VPLFVAALRKLREFQAWEVRHVPRAENLAADDLVNRMLDERAPRKKKKPVDEFDEMF
jgi:rhodanese-related sulfurtransferase